MNAPTPTLGELRDQVLLAYRFRFGSEVDFARQLKRFEFAVREAAFEEVMRLTGRRQA